MNRLLTIDLHAGQIQGFFNLPVDNLFSSPIMTEYFKEFAGGDLCIVSPDAGGVERARSFAKRLGATLAIIDKRRDAPNQAQAMHVIGDVSGKRCVVIDDMIDTAGTMCQAGIVLLGKRCQRSHGRRHPSGPVRTGHRPVGGLALYPDRHHQHHPVKRQGQGPAPRSRCCPLPDSWPRPCTTSTPNLRSASCSPRANRNATRPEIMFRPRAQRRYPI